MSAATDFVKAPWICTRTNRSSIGIRASDGFAVAACRMKAPDGRTTDYSKRRADVHADIIKNAPQTADAARAMLAALQRALPVLEKSAHPFNHEYSSAAAIRAAIAQAEAAGITTEDGQ